ncbi:MAG TPA: hypothetical protein VGF48_24555 [Thermoanaerobaculia bacterium]|jgi:hypothetical protein
MRNNGRASFFALFILLSFGKNILAEVPLGGTRLGPAPNVKLEPAVASDGRDFFAVWRDARTGRSEEVLGARITANGTVLDPTGIRLGNVSPADAPRVVFIGNAYMVFWTSWSVQTGSGNLWVTRVGRDGNVITPPRAIADGYSMLGSYVATNGRIVVAGYVRETIGSPTVASMHTVTLDPDANVLGHQLLTSSNVSRSRISITTIGDSFSTAGDGFVAVWSSFYSATSQVEGVRLSAAGEPIGTPQILGAGYDPEIASDGTYTLAVIRHAGGNDLSVATRLIRNDLGWVSTARSFPNGSSLSEAQVIRHGAGYLIVTTESSVTTRALLAMRVDAEGRPSVASSIALLPVQGVVATPRLASNGTDVMVVWVEANPGASQGYVRAQRIDPSALVARGERIEVARSAQRQTVTDLATDGTITLAVWFEDDALLAQRGSDAPIELARGTLLGPARAIFDGTSFLVAWSNRADDTVNVRFIDRATGTAGPHLSEVTHTPGNVALATNGESTLLVWSRGESRQIVAARLGSATRMFETTQRAISPDDMRADWPAAAWNGTTFLVAWSEVEYVPNDDSFFGGYESMRIRGTRVDRTLVPLDPASRVLADAPQVIDAGASLTSNGSDWMLAWTTQPINSVLAVARARRIRDDLTGYGSESGVRLGEGFLERVAFDGERYVAVWTNGGETKLAYLTRDALPHQPNVIVTAEPILSIAFVPLAPRRIMLAYSRVSWAPEHGGVSRAFLKLVELRTKTRPVR